MKLREVSISPFFCFMQAWYDREVYNIQLMYVDFKT